MRTGKNTLVFHLYRDRISVNNNWFIVPEHVFFLGGRCAMDPDENSPSCYDAVLLIVQRLGLTI